MPRLFLALLFAAAPSVSRAAADSPPIELSTFESQLRGIQNDLAQYPHTPQRIGQIESSLPSDWSVITPDGAVDVSSEPLRTLLQRAQRSPERQEALIQNAQDWLAASIDEAASYTSASAETFSQQDANDKLAKILRQREFATDYTPSPWQRFQRRVEAWVLRLLERIFERIGRHPTAARTFFWLVLIAAVAILASLLFRIWADRARRVDLKVEAATVKTQTWQEWVHVARMAADRGDFRDAIHATYWAGVVCLESSRSLPQERWRTPRERLSRFRAAPGDAPETQTRRRELLRALTSRLERCWYANLPANRQDYLDSVQIAEDLGCR